jgi:hypothetical protein
LKVVRTLILGAITVLATTPALAQSKTAQPNQTESSQWQKLPRMKLEAQFAGPLRDTIIQRWRDPGDGAVCYLYLPIAAPHSPPAPSGFVQYGSTTIGSISCFPNPSLQATAAPQPQAAPPRPASRSKK